MKFLRILTAFSIIISSLHGHAAAQEKSQVVRLAKLQIDPAQLEAYKAALKEEIETSMQIEPGVLALNAVSAKDHPEQVTILEIYADAQAYHAHLQSPHFTKYKTATQAMVRSLELMETVPIVLASKVK